MKKNRRNFLRLSIPAIRELREGIEKGNIGKNLIEMTENFGAGSTKVKYSMKNRPYVITVEARRLE